MELNIKDIKKSMEENKNIFEAYEDNEKSCEVLKKRYENELQDTAEPIKCSGIYAINNSATVTRWALIKSDGTTIYQSDKYKVLDTCTIDLEDQNRIIGTQFYLKANVEGSDSTYNVILEYDPTVDFAQFELRGTAFNTWINYLGSAPAPSL